MTCWFNNYFAALTMRNRYLSTMKTRSYLLLVVAVLLTTVSVHAQGSVSDQLDFQVHVEYPPLSITKEALLEAKTVKDLNQYYKPTWIRDFVSVEISAVVDGHPNTEKSKDDVLTRKQKDVLNNADPGTDVSVLVRYFPENTLSHNDEKVFDFAITFDPDHAASYPGGDDALHSYLKTKAVDHIPDGIFVEYALAAIKFTVGEKGEVGSASIFNSSGDEQVDDLLLETINMMPNWKPAQYADGSKSDQDFVLTVGNLENCMVSLLNIR